MFPPSLPTFGFLGPYFRFLLSNFFSNEILSERRMYELIIEFLLRKWLTITEERKKTCDPNPRSEENGSSNGARDCGAKKSQFSAPFSTRKGEEEEVLISFQTPRLSSLPTRFLKLKRENNYPLRFTREGRGV